MWAAPERLSAFGARTFPTVITTSVVQDLKEKIAGVDCMICSLSIAMHMWYQSRAKITPKIRFPLYNVHIHIQTTVHLCTAFKYTVEI
jgi:hypothetical protein